MVMAPPHPLWILELYSGIGGMHTAARESGLPFEIVGTYELNPTALEVYRHNFPGTNKPRNIMGLTVEELTNLNPSVIMMSPPCQPFTRQGLKRDVEDARTSSFLHLLGLLEEVLRPPDMILLENVAGFETSLARDRLVSLLKTRNYVWQEFLLSPTQLGVPNSRLRYYMLAKQKPATFCFTLSDKVQEEFPLCLCVKVEDSVTSKTGSCHRCTRPLLNSLHTLLHKFHSDRHPGSLHAVTSYTQVLPSLSHYLSLTDNLEPYLLKDKILNKYHMLLDIVDRESQRSCCFTKGYAHYVEGTGSVIQHNTTVNMAETYSKVQLLAADDSHRLELLRELQLRYFTPEEVTKLMCFPDWYDLPQSITNKQKYKVLGNSVNVLVVTSLLLMLAEN
ncbi:tRNA (cytosine(38)-C(5))-methyltransferase-like isoform X2 [Homarus americanus]|uniref:tRNA (cytosine(38)-C(5))-methyltransferase n=1 Tax=Homarus americanus TaxID=6706 RepID=A0A8J5ML91_HOMAM|nr:tRNA (cytosine(38)-C(5))-methyltransferase-like isoform X2 [Homarus americanus]KAG7155362.1 tRNA (cytosine-5-)-methyltransferase-like [Homarus americanus]